MSGRSALIAAGLALGLVLWMASGYLMRLGNSTVPDSPPSPATAPPMAVEVALLESRPVTRRVVSQGQTLPERTVTLRAETTGQVAEVLARRGALVAAGEPVVRLAMDDRAARLREAEALVRQRETDYEAARRLGDRGFQSAAALRQAEAALEQARAALQAIQLDIRRTRPQAPFDGVMRDRMVEVGDYLAPGDPIAEIVDNDPLRVRAAVDQQDVARLRVGGPARVELITGAVLEGEIRYIAPTAEPATRTFDVEVTVANPDGLPAGMSATVSLVLDTVQGHFISPALLSLDDRGDLGVKLVDADGRVRFQAVETLRAEADGLWVRGLPPVARVITVGQGFVRPGEAVRPVPAEAAR